MIAALVCLGVAAVLDHFFIAKATIPVPAVGAVTRLDVGSHATVITYSYSNISQTVRQGMSTSVALSDINRILASEQAGGSHNNELVKLVQHGTNVRDSMRTCACREKLS